MLDDSYTGDFGQCSVKRQPTVNNQIPSNLPAPPNLGGEIGQLEMGWPHDLGDKGGDFESIFMPVSPLPSSGQGAAPNATENFDSYMGNPLGAKI